MSNHILFVDDEQSLLNGIERRFGLDFELVTANSGATALEAMEEKGPFAVVVTDMRMPKMDGIQFIKEARIKAPDTVYIMLTGNQDQATAIRALNEGHVFRFLTKPCQSTELVKVVEAGLRQYQLVTAEKELLQNTFCGAVSVLTDVLELSHPDIFSRAERIQQVVQTLQRALPLEDHWEYKLAARLGLLGFALLPEDQQLSLDAKSQLGVAHEHIQRAAAIGQRLIERIPRLDTVAKIIGKQADVDGSAVIANPRTEESKAVMGATLLRVAIQWDALTRQGLSPRIAIAELKGSLPNLSTSMADALSELPTEEEGGEDVEVSIHDLEEGMVLCDDILTNDGLLLIRKGRRLTWTIIERLHGHQAALKQMPAVRVKETSIRTPSKLVLA